MPEANRSERIIKVADIEPQYRHAILSRLFEHLAPDQSLQVVVDHDPRRLRLQLEALHGSRCGWSYLEQGPYVWRVRLRLLGTGVETMGEPRIRSSGTGRSPDFRGLSRAERLEFISLVAAVGISECSAWIIPMLERGGPDGGPLMEKLKC